MDAQSLSVVAGELLAVLVGTPARCLDPGDSTKKYILHAGVLHARAK